MYPVSPNRFFVLLVRSLQLRVYVVTTTTSTTTTTTTKLQVYAIYCHETLDLEILNLRIRIDTYLLVVGKCG